MVGRVLTGLRAQWMGAVALFLVIAGGTAYAANTVGSADIINGQVKSADIGTGQVQSIDVKNESLTGDDIANNSIRTDELDFQSVGWEQLEFGAVSTFAYTSQAATASNTSQVKELTVTCDDSGADTDKVTGGGYVVEGTDAYIHRSYAVDDRTWLVRAASVSPTPGNWKLTVVADCVA